MNLGQFKIEFTNQLTAYYPKEEILSFYKLLVAHYLKIDRATIILKKDLELSKGQLNVLNKGLKSLKNFVPIQYIIGNCSFFGLDLTLNKHVLIPRPETEELVAWILEAFTVSPHKQSDKEISILDFGTGSGCIAISLAKHLPKAKVYALDISKEAIKIAQRNALLNKVQLHFIEVDMLDLLALKRTEIADKKFDLIVSNPPYVTEAEKQSISRNVLDYEPHQALFVPNNHPLIYYKAILNFAQLYLKSPGSCFFEINQSLANECILLLKNYNPLHVELRKDIFDNDRMIKAVF